MKNIVTIVFDDSKSKYRAQAPDGGWVRFPNDLRVEGAVYEVEELRKGKSGSWIAVGEITEVNPNKVKVEKVSDDKISKELDEILNEDKDFDFIEELKKAR